MNLKLNIILLLSIIILSYLLSLTNYIFVASLFCFSLFIVIMYSYVFSKRSSFWNEVLSLCYIAFGFSFAVFSTFTIFYNYQYTLFSTTLFFFTFFSSSVIYGMRYFSIIHFILKDIFKKKALYTQSCELGCSIVITTRNEPFDICKMTFDSAYALDYPSDKKEIIIVDNSDLTHNELRDWQSYITKHNMKDGFRCIFIHRRGTEGLQARNMDIATQKANYDYLLFLDADSTMPVESLKVGLTEFIKNNNLAYLQFYMQATNSNHNIEAKAISIFMDILRYNDVSVQNSMFAGHNAIFTKESLQSINGFEKYFIKERPMVTHDLNASLILYNKGFDSKAISFKTGEWVPMSLKEFDSMWIRWSLGGIQIFYKYIYIMLKSKKVTPMKKIEVIQQFERPLFTMFPIVSLLMVIYPQKSISLIFLLNLSMLYPLFFVLWYFSFNKRKLTGNLFSKLYQLYNSTFILPYAIVWCDLKAQTLFWMNKPIKWTPTSKKISANDKLGVNAYPIRLIYSSIGIILFASTIYRYFNDKDLGLYLQFMFPCIFFYINTILGVFLYEESFISRFFSKFRKR